MGEKTYKKKQKTNKETKKQLEEDEAIIIYESRRGEIFDDTIGASWLDSNFDKNVLSL